MKMSEAKKATRTEAFEYALRLKLGEPVSPEEIDALLRYFSPPLPKVAKTAEQWVAKAAGVADKRYYLRYVYVSQGVAMASDGHRLHRCVTSWADGYYDPKTQLPVDFVPESVGFPVDAGGRFFADRARAAPFYIEDLEAGAVMGSKPPRLIEYLRVPDGVAVNRAYLADATNGAESGPLEYGEQRMYGTNDFGDWIVQGMRV